MANRRDSQFLWTPHLKSTLLDCSFVISSTNIDGTGISDLKKSGRIAQVLAKIADPISFDAEFVEDDIVLTVSSVAGLQVGMVIADADTPGNFAAGTTILSIDSGLSEITVSTPALGDSAASPGDAMTATIPAASYLDHSNVLAAGVIQVFFQDNYVKNLSGFNQIGAALGSPTNSFTNHSDYVITTVGSTTTAQWVAAGLPIGITPAVGVSFVATATAVMPGTGRAALTATAGSGITRIEVIGDPSKTISITGVNAGSYVLLQCFAASTKTQPADGSLINLSFYMNSASFGV